MGESAVRKILALGLAVLVVLALWTGGWFWATSEIRHQVEILAEADGETSPRLVCGTLDITGFPFRFDIDCEELALTFGDHDIALAGLRASVLAYNPTHVIFSARPPYAMSNAFTGSQSRFDFADLEGSARLTARDMLAGLSGEGWRIARISLVANKVTWNDTVIEDLLQAKAEKVELHLLDMPELHDAATRTAGLALYASLEGADVPGFNVAGANATLEAEFTGLPDDLRFAAEPNALQLWQQSGGAMKLVRFAGNQPDPADSFEVTGEAAMTPTGLINARIDYTTKGVFERFSNLLPMPTLAIFRGTPQDDGSFRGELSMTDSRMAILGTPLFELLPLW
jgi:hypothetical protein